MNTPIKLDPEIIESNKDALCEYSHMREELNNLIKNSTRKAGIYKEILDVLDLTAEWVNGDPDERIEKSVYFILS